MLKIAELLDIFLEPIFFLRFYDYYKIQKNRIYLKYIFFVTM